MANQEVISDERWAPSAELEAAWKSIVVPDEVKNRLLRHTLLAVTVRPKLAFYDSGLHGFIVLTGPPGTGKTTLAEGLASAVAPFVADRRVRLLTVDAHALMSAQHGRSQQQVHDVFLNEIPSRAADGALTLVLFDEVESIAVSRNAASLATNPADVHRATDAVLTGIDTLTKEHAHIVAVATSNFPDSVDAAVLSRADAVIDVPLPTADVVATILAATLSAMARSYPPLEALARDRRLGALAQTIVGADGRQARKLVTAAMARRDETVVDPGKLSFADLDAAAADLRAELTPAKASRAAA